MIRVTSFAGLQQVGSTFLNTLQDQAASCSQANKNNDLTGMTQGWDMRAWISNAALSAATLVELDTSVDWRDRFLMIWYRDIGSANARPGQSNDYQFDVGTGAGSAPVVAYTGKGGYSNVNTLAAISNGVPPVSGSGSGANPSYVIVLAGAARANANAGAPTTTSASLFLYADPANGNALRLYNNTGAGLGNQLQLVVAFSGKTGKRP